MQALTPHVACVCVCVIARIAFHMSLSYLSKKHFVFFSFLFFISREIHRTGKTDYFAYTHMHYNPSSWASISRAGVSLCV